MRLDFLFLSLADRRHRCRPELAPQSTTRMVGPGVTSAIVTMISTILLLNAILTLAS